jgi:transcriptional regulator GlxA family with amidase domain
MTHSISIGPETNSLANRALSVGRFVLHFCEMVLAMYVGMLIYMPLDGLIPTAVQQIGMALFMAWPMVVWMRIRGHGWRHGFEMSLAMLIPWAVLLGAAKVFPSLPNVADWGMYFGMLGYMLVRRDHHHAHGRAHEHSPARHQRRFNLRPILLAMAYLAAVVLVPLGMGTFNIGSKWTSAPEAEQAPSLGAPLPALPVPDPSKKIAVVLSSAHGAEITDTLPNFEILADSGAFNVYSVAPERTVLPLISGSSRATTLDFIPHFSYAEYESQIGRDPDLIVIPGMPGYTPGRDAAMLDWIRGHAGPNTTVLSICIGGIILADTGLLDGHGATNNTAVLADPSFAARHTATTWVPNVRWYDDGTMVESTTLTSGIDATLHIVDRFAGRATALDVARQIGYTNTIYLDDPSWAWPSEQWPTLQPFDDRVGSILLTAAFRPQQNLGIPVFDGVSEAGLAGLIDPQSASLNIRTFAIAPDRNMVQSRNGFQFVPRYDFHTVPALDRVLVPAGPDTDARRQIVAAWSAEKAHRPVEDIFQNVPTGETAYEATFEDLARTQGGNFARNDASLWFYVMSPSRLDGADWNLADVLTPLLIGLLGAAVVYGASHLRLPQRGRLQAIPQPA